MSCPVLSQQVKSEHGDIEAEEKAEKMREKLQERGEAKSDQSLSRSFGEQVFNACAKISLFSPLLSPLSTYSLADEKWNFGPNKQDLLGMGEKKRQGEDSALFSRCSDLTS